MQPTFSAREAKGGAIAREFGWVQRVDETSYKDHSQSMNKEYSVEQTETGWICSCPDFTFRGSKCKHVWADGGHHFITPIQKEFYVKKAKLSEQTKHVKDIRLDGTVHNNKMERPNGEIRDREKVMRGLKRVDTPILKGYQIYHNFIREHKGLDGKTPAEAAGIKVEGENRWLTIIQNASRKI